MGDPEINRELLRFFKALADANRLKMVGLLAEESYTVEELAEILSLSPSTVSHHLSRLSKAGLVRARAESYYHIYSLETGTLESMARRLLSEETLPKVAGDIDLNAYDRKVVSNYIRADGSLKTIPSQRKKLEAVLRYVAEAFEPGVRYPEREVNQVLSRFHEDTATLRRELVGAKLMEREGGGGHYWRAEN